MYYLVRFAKLKWDLPDPTPQLEEVRTMARIFVGSFHDGNAQAHQAQAQNPWKNINFNNVYSHHHVCFSVSTINFIKINV